MTLSAILENSTFKVKLLSATCTATFENYLATFKNYLATFANYLATFANYLATFENYLASFALISVRDHF